MDLTSGKDTKNQSNIKHRMSIFKIQLFSALICPFSAAAAAKSLQSCPTQCDPIDGSPPGSPIPGIL